MTRAHGTGGANSFDDRPDRGGKTIRLCDLRLASLRAGFDQIARIAELHALCLLGCKRGARALGNQAPFLLGQRRIEMQHEWVGIGAQFGHDERHALRHQARHEGDIARQPVELGDNNGALVGLGGGERCGKLWAAIEGIGALAAFGLDELPDQEKALGQGEPLNGGALGFAMRSE